MGGRGRRDGAAHHGGRGRRSWIVALALLAAACGADEPEQPDAPPASAAGFAGEGVVAELDLPDTLRPGGEGELVARVANRGRAPLDSARLEVWLDPRLEPVFAPGADTSRLARTPQGARISFAVQALPAGQAREWTQRVRLPAAVGDTAPAGLPGPDRFVVRAGVFRAGGKPVGTPADDTLAVLGPAAAAAGCGGGGRLPVTRHGVGAVRLGMTREQLAPFCPEIRDTTWTAEGMTETGLVIPFGQDTLLAVTGRNGSIQRLVVGAPGLTTAAGAGVGTPLGELRSRYGRTCAGVGEGAVAVWFPNAPGISFALSAAPPPEWGAGPADPAALPDTATVTRFWVRQGTDDCPPRAGEGGR